MIFFQFNKESETITEIEKGDLFFIRRIIFERITKESNIYLDIHVLFLDTEKDLLGRNCLDSFITKFGSIDTFKPILTIGTKKLNKYDNNFDPRFLILDSSIWFYYTHKINTKIISETIELISNQQEMRETNVSKEHIELYWRMFTNANLLETEGAHSKFISPFIFHSEQIMKIKANLLARNKFTEIKWNCLLIDDYSDLPLASSEKNHDNSRKSKKEIIESILENQINSDNIQISTTIDDGMDNKDLIWKSLNKLSKKTYDIILLDYLLGEKTNINNIREYSHELLSIIDKICRREKGFGGSDDYSKLITLAPNDVKNEFSKSNQNLKEIVSGILKHKGPLGKYWILNISSFQTAFLDRLREQGLGHNSEQWYLSRGADPVNTPELFRYTFFSFLQLQLSQVLFDKKDIISFLTQNKLELKEDNGYVRSWAKSVYGAYMYKFGRREIIHINKENKSKFAESIVQYINEDNRIEDFMYYNHVRELLFQLAYDTGHNSNQILELIKLVRTETQDEDQFKETFVGIEDYLKLISNNI